MTFDFPKIKAKQPTMLCNHVLLLPMYTILVLDNLYSYFEVQQPPLKTAQISLSKCLFGAGMCSPSAFLAIICCKTLHTRTYIMREPIQFNSIPR